MADVIYPHDAQLYDRRFLNCAERHALVFLKERLPEVDCTLYRALVSSDDIFQQIIQEKRPKYNFTSGCMAEADLNALGIVTQTLRSDTFASLKTDAAAVLQQHCFALLSGSVFYFAHCPEFRKKHLHHLVVLHGMDAQEQHYRVVDDNPASVLCEYSYAASDVAAFYDNNGDRLLRYFRLDDYAKSVANDYFADAFRAYIDQFQDSQQLFGSVGDYLAMPFEATDNKLQLLHDSFSLLSGSRSLFAHYLRTQAGQETAVELAQQLSHQAFVLKSLMVKARITKRMDVADIESRVQRLQGHETQLLDELRRRNA